MFTTRVGSGSSCAAMLVIGLVPRVLFSNGNLFITQFFHPIYHLYQTIPSHSYP